MNLLPDRVGYRGVMLLQYFPQHAGRVGETFVYADRAEGLFCVYSPNNRVRVSRPQPFTLHSSLFTIYTSL